MSTPFTLTLYDSFSDREDLPPPIPSSSSRKRKSALPSSASPIKKRHTPAAAIGGWEPAHESFLLEAKRAGMTVAAMREELKSRFGVVKSPNAIQKYMSKVCAKNYEWSQEMEGKLVEAVNEFFANRKNNYAVVRSIFAAMGEQCRNVKTESVIAKLKALEKEGKIGALGAQG